MDLWVFDNDGTLYDDSIAKEQFMKILSEYVSQLLNIPIDQVLSEITRLKLKWNTDATVVALMKEYKLDFAKIVGDTYLKIKLEKCSISAPDLARFSILNAIPWPKVVFTNNPSVFARYILSYVGLAGCFSDFIGIQETRFYGKPDLKAYKTVEKRHKGFNRIIFCDDSLKNLDVARKLGWITVWYNPQSVDITNNSGHLVISSFEELRKLL